MNPDQTKPRVRYVHCWTAAIPPKPVAAYPHETTEDAIRNFARAQRIPPRTYIWGVEHAEVRQMLTKPAEVEAA